MCFSLFFSPTSSALHHVHLSPPLTAPLLLHFLLILPQLWDTVVLVTWWDTQTVWLVTHTHTHSELLAQCEPWPPTCSLTPTHTTTPTQALTYSTTPHMHLHELPGNWLLWCCCLCVCLPGSGSLSLLLMSFLVDVRAAWCCWRRWWESQKTAAGSHQVCVLG